MREINLYLRNSVYSSSVVNSVNSKLDTRIPVIVRGQGVKFVFRLFNDLSGSSLSAVGLSELAVTWALNISPASDNISPVCLRSDSFEILSDGRLVVSIGVTDTVESARVIGRLPRVVWSAELCGYRAGSLSPSAVLRFRVCYENRVFSDGSAPTENISLFYTRSQVDSLLADLGGSVPQATIVQYGTVKLASQEDIDDGVGSGVVTSSVLKGALDNKTNSDVIPNFANKEDRLNKSQSLTELPEGVTADKAFPSVAAVNEGIDSKVDEAIQDAGLDGVETTDNKIQSLAVAGVKTKQYPSAEATISALNADRVSFFQALDGKLNKSAIADINKHLSSCYFYFIFDFILV